MRNILTSRFGRASAAVALGALALFATGATAEARPWHYWHNGYYYGYGWSPPAYRTTWYNPYWGPRYYSYAPPAYVYAPPAYSYYGPEPVGPSFNLTIPLR